MERIEVSTQKELDEALARDGVIPVCVGSGVFRVGGSATVYAGDSATVYARGSATVDARGSATVYAGDSATVYAGDSATVYARGSATVYARGSATVYAGDFVAIHRNSTAAKITGGVVITPPDRSTAEGFLAWQRLTVEDGLVVMYKAVDGDFLSRTCAPSGERVSYAPGTQPECEDWDAAPHCGQGLHFSPTPAMARDYCRDAKRYVGCPLRVDELVVIEDYGNPDKVKAPRVAGPCFEVDRWGRPVKVEGA